MKYNRQTQKKQTIRGKRKNKKTKTILNAKKYLGGAVTVLMGKDSDLEMEQEINDNGENEAYYRFYTGDSEDRSEADYLYFFLAPNLYNDNKLRYLYLKKKNGDYKIFKKNDSISNPISPTGLKVIEGVMNSTESPEYKSNYPIKYGIFTPKEEDIISPENIESIRSKFKPLKI